MCGIVGAIGNIDIRKYILEGLNGLDYRGYDSAGIAYVLNGEINIYKTLGHVDELKKIVPLFENSSLGIGHTRWATHGLPSIRNAHPIKSFKGIITLVHNGVIENVGILKNKLTELGYSYSTDTDSEVIADLLEVEYIKSGNIIRSMSSVLNMLEGSFALGIIVNNDFDNLYCMKRSSPLVIGSGNGFNMIASDEVPIIEYTNKMLDLKDDQIASISSKEIVVYDSLLEEVDYTLTHKEASLLKRDLAGYPHFMLKEIEESEFAIRKLMISYYQNSVFNFDNKLLENLRDSDNIIFIACGSSYHASLIASRYFRSINKFSEAYIASEWAYYPQVTGKSPFVIFVSQSGETADLIHCLKITKKLNLKTLVITNTNGSTLKRECDYSIPLNAGLEVSVASTKSFVAQVTALMLLINALTSNYKIIRDLDSVIKTIESIKLNTKEKIKDLANLLFDKKDIYFLGRGYDYDIALEASLKVKEVTYIHSEAIPGGELKHGSMALIENGVPIIVFISDDKAANSMRNNIEEVKARGAIVYVISTKSLSNIDDYIVIDDIIKPLTPIALSIISFYLSYYISINRNLNPDKPRNLAKSVTVE